MLTLLFGATSLLLMLAIGYVIRIVNRMDRRMAAYERVRDIADWSAPNGDDPPRGRHLQGLPSMLAKGSAIGLTLTAAATVLGIVASSPWSGGSTSIQPPVALALPPAPPITGAAPTPVSAGTSSAPPAPVAVPVTLKLPRRARSEPATRPHPVGVPAQPPSAPLPPSTPPPATLLPPIPPVSLPVACVVRVSLPPLLDACL